MSDDPTPEPNLLHSLYQRSLDALTRDEWESLCDGCGRCCLHRLHDLDDIIWETRVACTLLDTNTCQCSDYPNRHDQVPGCLRLTPHLARTLDWLPDTCAYRLVAHGQPLPDWHHLVSGDRNTVHTAGVSVRGQIISEDEVDPDEYHLWIWDAEPA